MILDSVESRYLSDDGSTVTFEFECRARLAAAEEAACPWALNVSWRSFGMTVPRGDLPPLPQVKAGTIVVSPGQTPNGKAQGDRWKPTFRHRFTKSEILVDNSDQYLFTTSLVPLVDVNPTNSQTHVLQTDID